eukprot:Sspe_Gene.25492::Locus_10261_Transcript_1_1_Confidence_1.000_Length_3956::g.25492::m.25492
MASRSPSVCTDSSLDDEVTSHSALVPDAYSRRATRRETISVDSAPSDPNASEEDLYDFCLTRLASRVSRQDVPRALVVSSSPLTRTVTRLLFTRSGFQVAEAGGGKEAVNAFLHSKARYDLILVDTASYEVDSLELVRVAHAEGQHGEHYHRAAILALLTPTREGEVELTPQEAVEMGFDLFCRTPMSRAVVGHLVELFLSATSRSQELSHMATSNYTRIRTILADITDRATAQQVKSSSRTYKNMVLASVEAHPAYVRVQSELHTVRIHLERALDEVNHREAVIRERDEEVMRLHKELNEGLANLRQQLDDARRDIGHPPFDPTAVQELSDELEEVDLELTSRLQAASLLVRMRGRLRGLEEALREQADSVDKLQMERSDLIERLKQRDAQISMLEAQEQMRRGSLLTKQNNSEVEDEDSTAMQAKEKQRALTEHNHLLREKLNDAMQRCVALHAVAQSYQNLASRLERKLMEGEEETSRVREKMAAVAANKPSYYYQGVPYFECITEWGKSPTFTQILPPQGSASSTVTAPHLPASPPPRPPDEQLAKGTPPALSIQGHSSPTQHLQRPSPIIPYVPVTPDQTHMVVAAQRTDEGLAVPHPAPALPTPTQSPPTHPPLVVQIPVSPSLPALPTTSPSLPPTTSPSLPTALPTPPPSVHVHRAHSSPLPPPAQPPSAPDCTDSRSDQPCDAATSVTPWQHSVTRSAPNAVLDDAEEHRSGGEESKHGRRLSYSRSLPLLFEYRLKRSRSDMWHTQGDPTSIIMAAAGRHLPDDVVMALLPPSIAKRKRRSARASLDDKKEEVPKEDGKPEATSPRVARRVSRVTPKKPVSFRRRSIDTGRRRKPEKLERSGSQYLASITKMVSGTLDSQGFANANVKGCLQAVHTAIIDSEGLLHAASKEITKGVERMTAMEMQGDVLEPSEVDFTVPPATQIREAVKQYRTKLHRIMSTLVTRCTTHLAKAGKLLESAGTAALPSHRERLRERDLHLEVATGCASPTAAPLQRRSSSMASPSLGHCFTPRTPPSHALDPKPSSPPRDPAPLSTTVSFVLEKSDLVGGVAFPSSSFPEMQYVSHADDTTGSVDTGLRGKIVALHRELMQFFPECLLRVAMHLKIQDPLERVAQNLRELRGRTSRKDLEGVDLSAVIGADLEYLQAFNRFFHTETGTMRQRMKETWRRNIEKKLRVNRGVQTDPSLVAGAGDSPLLSSFADFSLLMVDNDLGSSLPKLSDSGTGKTATPGSGGAVLTFGTSTNQPSRPHGFPSRPHRPVAATRRDCYVARMKKKLKEEAETRLHPTTRHA